MGGNQFLDHQPIKPVFKVKLQRTWVSFVKNEWENSSFCCREPRLIRMQPHSGCTLSAITLSPWRQIIGGSVVPPKPPRHSPMPSCLRAAHTSAGLTADGGQHIITFDEYGGGPLGFRGNTAKNDNEGVHPPAATSSPPPLRDRPRSHLKVVTEAKRHRWGGSSRSSQSDMYLKKSKPWYALKCDPCCVLER